MAHDIDDTHDPALASWVESANDPAGDFPIQNLPFGRFRRAAGEPWRIGVAIGDALLDLRQAGLVDTDDMNALMAAGAPRRRALRQALSQGLRRGSARRTAWEGCLAARRDVEMAVPCRIGDYTDFYTSIHHATAVGKQFRPDSPLLPNYKWVPIGYHGRASSIGVSGGDIRRPQGQSKGPDDALPRFGGPDAVDALQIALYRGSWLSPFRTRACRTAAAAALARMASPAAKEALRTASTRGTLDVRMIARSHLKDAS